VKVVYHLDLVLVLDLVRLDLLEVRNHSWVHSNLYPIPTYRCVVVVVADHVADHAVDHVIHVEEVDHVVEHWTIVVENAIFPVHVLLHSY